MAIPKETTNANASKVAESLKEVCYDVKNLVNDTIDNKILGIARSTNIFNALDCIDLAQRIRQYDMLRTIIIEGLDKFFAEKEKEL